MKQCFHTIIKPARNGRYVGWVEEVPGTITHGRSLADVRRNLKDALLLMVETRRDEARRAMDSNTIVEAIEIDLDEPEHTSHFVA
jgi:predicted RNase H-like HicB family nuclease